MTALASPGCGGCPENRTATARHTLSVDRPGHGNTERQPLHYAYESNLWPPSIPTHRTQTAPFQLDLAPVWLPRLLTMKQSELFALRLPALWRNCHDRQMPS